MTTRKMEGEAVQGKIGNRLLKTLKPKDKPYSVTDTELPGFVVRVMTSGSLSYGLVYRCKDDGRRVRYTIGSTRKWTAAQARDEAKRVIGVVNAGGDPMADKREARADRASTLGEFLEGSYTEWAMANRKAGKNTVRRLKTSFRGLLGKKLDKVTAWDIEKWRSRRVKESAKKTTGNRDIACLKAAMGKAVEWGLLLENPLSSVKLAKTDRSARPRTLTDDEETRMWTALHAREERLRRGRDSHNLWLRERGLSELRDLRKVQFADHLRPMLTVVLHTGLRRGEAFSLEWRDVDLDDGWLTVRGEISKSAQTRKLPLNGTAWEVLRAWHAQQDGDGLVFPSPQTGQRFDNITKAWRAIMKESNIEALTLHMLRHTFASRTLAGGADIETVRRLLGHRDIATTSIYLHGSQDRDRAAVEALDRGPRDNVTEFPVAASAGRGDSQ